MSADANPPSNAGTDVVTKITHLFEANQFDEAVQIIDEQLRTSSSDLSSYDVFRFGKLLWARDRKAGLKLLEKAASTAHDELNWAHTFVDLLPFREMYKRYSDGLPMYHADTLDELGVRCNRDELNRLRSAAQRALENSPKDYDSARLHSHVAFISGNYSDADKSYQHAGLCRPGQIESSVKFEPSFYESLEQVQYTEHLPATIDIAPADVSGHVLFLACDSNYFVRFATPLMRSLQAHNPGAQVHLHVMMPQHAHAGPVAKTVEQFSELTVKITGEVIPEDIAENHLAAARYYHGVRFIRLAQYLMSGSNTMWLADVDAIVNRNIKPVFDMMTGRDIGLRIRPGRVEPWNQFSACLVAATSSPKSTKYFNLVAAYLHRLLTGSGLAWGADQLALFGVHRYLAEHGEAPDIKFWGPDATDVGDYDPNAYFWFAAGKKKILYVQNPDLTPDTETDRRFWSQFRTYVG